MQLPTVSREFAPSLILLDFGAGKAIDVTTVAEVRHLTGPALPGILALTWEVLEPVARQALLEEDCLHVSHPLDRELLLAQVAETLPRHCGGH